MSAPTGQGAPKGTDTGGGIWTVLIAVLGGAGSSLGILALRSGCRTALVDDGSFEWHRGGFN